MKKSNIFIGCLIVLMLAATFAACASSPQQESTGEFIDDSVITTKVKSSLAGDDFLKSFRISVKTRKGIVKLSGSVDSQEAFNRAGKIAGSVGGVRSVRNGLVVK